MWAKRVKDLIAAWIAGNGVLMLIAPRQRSLLWVVERPGWLSNITIWLADHPTVLRLRGIVWVGIVVWLALRQYKEAS